MNSTYKTASCKIVYGQNMTENDFRFSVELAQIIGFWQISAEFPVVCAPEDMNDRTTEYFVFGSNFSRRDHVVPVCPGNDPAGEWERLYGILEKMHTGPSCIPESYAEAPVKQDILTDIPSDPFLIRAGLNLPEEADRSLWASACSIAVRIGMEKNTVSYGLLNGNRENRILLTLSDREPEAIFESGSVLRISARRDSMETFVCGLCTQFTGLGAGSAHSRFLHQVKEALKTYTVTKPYEDFSMELPIEDDRDIVRDILEKRLWSAVSPGDRITIEAALYKSRNARDAFAQELQQLAGRCGAELQTVFLCTYKQGLSWICDSVIPELRKLDPPGRITICFDPADTSPWRKGTAEDIPGSKPPRWLQNLYPADEILASELGIQSDAVEFEALTDDSDCTFAIKVYDRANALIFEARHTVPVRIRPYMEQFPEYGTLITETGYLRVSVNGNTVISEMICSDADQVWKQYQERILPEAMRLASAADLSSSAMPFFRDITMDIAISGWEQKIGAQTDHISSGETLEDALHNAGHHMFQLYGRNAVHRDLSAPGLFLPLIHLSDKKPSFTAVFHAPERKTLSGSRSIVLNAFREINGRVIPCFSLENAESSDFAKIRDCLGEIGAVCVNGTVIEKAPAEDTKKEFAETAFDRLIGYEQYKDIMMLLADHPDFDVWQQGSSYQGRKIWCVSPKRKDAGFVSHHKRFEFLPTILINGRHHSNEVSATNAVFRLLREMTQDKSWEEITQKVNLIFVPVENVDGAALHYELCREHPDWQHHCAYTNSLGADLMPNYYIEDTIHTEALVFRELFLNCMPDAMIDLHGVPHHELSADYSPLGGYAGLWLPRSLMCSFYFHIHDNGYESNESFTRAWKSAVTAGFSDIPEFSELSERMNSRFLKYSWGDTDNTYKNDLEGSMLNYWIPSPYNERHPYPSVCWPWCCTMMFTAEAADETAHGAWLSKCAQAHMVHMKAGIELTAGSSYYFKTTKNAAAGTFTVKRMRPLTANEGE